MFVTAADFDGGDYNIPVSFDAPTALEQFIPQKEKYILKKLLGSVTYNEFVNALFVDPSAVPLVPIAENLIPQKWKDLRDGADYSSYGSGTYRYDGVRSFLIPYIYAEWWEKNATSESSLGVTEPVIENSRTISPMDQIIEKWNEFADLVGSCEDCNDSLWGFMDSRYEVDFVDWSFIEPGYKNEFDL